MRIKNYFKKTRKNKINISDTSTQVRQIGKKQLQRLERKGISVQLFVSP